MNARHLFNGMAHEVNDTANTEWYKVSLTFSIKLAKMITAKYKPLSTIILQQQRETNDERL
jgi:hypothetical protein